MLSLPDSHGEARRAAIQAMQDDLMPIQSDFEKSKTFRFSLLVVLIVICFDVFAPPANAPASSHASVHRVV